MTTNPSPAQSETVPGDLLPCPFCGERPVVQRYVEEYDADHKFPAGEYEVGVTIRCHNCAVEQSEEYRSEAIAAWNRRPPILPQEAEPAPAMPTIDWQPGSMAFFEYCCTRSHESDHARHWYHSHQWVQIIGLDEDHSDVADTLPERCEAGEPRVYTVLFQDGFIADVFEYELYPDLSWATIKSAPPSFETHHLDARPAPDPKDDPRYPALLADAIARGKGENLDGSPRRHAVAEPAPVASQDTDALREAVNRAAVTWCGERDRETFSGDVTYFKNNWRAMPGLRRYVEIEMGRAALSATQQGEE